MPAQSSKQQKQFFMKPWFWALIIVLAIGLWVWSTYNSLVMLNVNVDGKWAQVQVQLQRRYDLIPNLVNTVSAYAQFEKSTLTEITQLRSQWAASASVNQQVQTSNQIESALSKILAVFEAYPDLKTNTVLQNLQFELAGTENRIAVARQDYNTAVQQFNTAIRFFPASTIAGWFGFTEKTFFNATVIAQTTVPQVPTTLT